jgi:hypothetical protein
MTREIISKKTRTVLRELLVGTTLRYIDDEFEAAHVSCDTTYEPAVSGQRRSRVEQYYRTMDFTSSADARRFIQVCDATIAGMDHQHISELLTWLERDGFVLDGKRFRSVKPREHAAALSSVADKLGADHLQNLVDRMNEAIEDDPGLAIGTAKELLECCCKTILAEHGKSVSPSADVVELVKLARAELKLLPDGVPEAAKGVEVIKPLLSNLASVAQGLAELRGLYGSGHGREGRVRGLTPRHARLAAGAASTLAAFLFDTHKERSKTSDQTAVPKPGA